MFRPSTTFDLQRSMAASAANYSTTRKMSLASNDRIPLPHSNNLQPRLGGVHHSGDVNNSTAFSDSDLNMKSRNFANLPHCDDEESDDHLPPPTKLRISTNLLDQPAPISIGSSHTNNNSNNNNNNSNNNLITNETSTSSSPPPPPSSSVLPKLNQSHQQPNNCIPNHHDDDLDNETQSSSPEHNNFHKTEDVKIPTGSEYFLQQQHQLHQQQQQQHQQQQHPQQHLYDDHQQHFDQQYQQSTYTSVGVFLQETEHNNSRQRKERMSKRQKELYVEFIEQNPIINSHRRNDPVLDTFWLRLANILNECPNGAAKSVAEWKQAFDNWRYRVFLYARHNSQLHGEDALNSKAFKPLTRTDKRAYNLWIRNPDTAPANVEKLPNDFVCSED